MATIKKGCVVADVRFDSAPGNPGWYAQYRGRDGSVIDDSMKAWHEDMPRRRNAEKAALRVASRHARSLAKKECAR